MGSDRVPTMRTQGTYGPFQPNMPSDVPLWLAIMLHKRKKCRIQPPRWMNPQHLQGECQGQAHTQLCTSQTGTHASGELPHTCAPPVHLCLKRCMKRSGA
jgi:hypothetical protein